MFKLKRNKKPVENINEESTTSRERAMLKYIKRKGKGTASGAAHGQHTSRSWAARKLNNMEKEGKLEKHREGYTIIYTIPETSEPNRNQDQDTEWEWEQENDNGDTPLKPLALIGIGIIIGMVFKDKILRFLKQDQKNEQVPRDAFGNLWKPISEE